MTQHPQQPPQVQYPQHPPADTYLQPQYGDPGSTQPPADAGPEVGDLVGFVHVDGDGHEHPRRGLVVELVEQPGEGEETVSYARVVELPEPRTIRADQLTDA